ncbi:FAD/NAD(P)-binding protein [Stenotrophomonas sp. S48]|uniref:FAD/NAD(P)-binding protein n=1 Tax=unclassified Stenotrophomonas TaxID=196198 RepID=UPI0019021C8E|nr:MULTISPECIES: FAD/NAD(P)-binding protein [unclassified Stenotrophomonas]MBK0025978.1 FAD/NAD(P)-binding protein [Stenotrophomonas sp. S48]MBK0049672.1 FAD/NAD(P)-binding protein [Stenotrophomonas sp. S49]
MAYNPRMTDSARTAEADLAIIGGGAAGVLVALHVLQQARQPLCITLFEPASQPAQGIAYSTPWPEHLLNVPAAKMSAFPEQPGDFLDYLEAANAYPGEARDVLGERYVCRHYFASYLQQRLQQAAAASPAHVQVIVQPVLALQVDAHGCQLQLGDGQVLRAEQAVLATGNSMRPLPVPGADALPADAVVEAWDYDGVRTLAGTQALAIVGSGLSMADTVLALVAAGHRGPLHVISRHGLLPLPHDHGALPSFDPASLLPLTLRQRLRVLRQHAGELQAAGQPWQGVMDRIRAHGQALWCSLDAADQRRFLRHVVRYWDVHRHRIAEDIDAQLQALLASGQLQIHRARLQQVRQQDGALLLGGRSADGADQAWAVAGIINATGVETRATALRNPLLQQLLADGVARPGPHGLGLDSSVPGDRLHDAQGRPQSRLGVLGSLRIGSLWESLAVPELRQQAQALAAQVVAGHATAMP